MTKVLLVDADILVRASLAAYLRECGLHVLEAANDEEARALLSEHSATIDILFADAGSAEAIGFALASLVRQEHPGIGVILAGNIETATRKAGDLCDDQPSISKPYDHRFVLDRIRRAVAARERSCGSPRTSALRRAADTE
ncbi:response regulator [Rhizorhapis sp. SPR117]|uniref:response regulator n=1 Tax=Rhizorhapis sp. SPR117 TaxID=2912611 RepID=UPI001F29EA57|nr:response regulator [Rhizorhapis sp. SPR117]